MPVTFIGGSKQPYDGRHFLRRVRWVENSYHQI